MILENNKETLIISIYIDNFLIILKEKNFLRLLKIFY